MTKRNRAKSKAKRFGKGSVRAEVSASTYGVGNAFASLGADAPAAPPRGVNARGQQELLVVDGYNIIHATPRYERLIFDRADDPYSSDVYDAARTALIADVAAFAQGSYEAVIVFDGAGNVSPARPNLPQAGIRIEFSPTGVSADTVVQRLCTEAREEGRACSVGSGGDERRDHPVDGDGQGRHADLGAYARGGDRPDRPRDRARAGGGAQHEVGARQQALARGPREAGTPWARGEQRGVGFACAPIRYIKTGHALAHPAIILWSQRQESNPQPTDYKSVALPLSHAGAALSILEGKPGCKTARCRQVTLVRMHVGMRPAQRGAPSCRAPSCRH